MSVASNLQRLLGQTVKSHRQELGLSQEELAWRAGLHRTYVTDVERGARNLSLATVDRLAQALQVPVSILLREVDNARGTAQAHPPEELAQVDILLVEDNPRDVELTLAALRKARLANRIRVASNGAEALEYLFSTGTDAERTIGDRPRLVLLDLKLPRVDGLEVLRSLKSDPKTRDIPVVVLTVSQRSKDVTQARQLGADAYIVKPIDFKRLSEVTPKLDLSWRLYRSFSSQTK